MKLDIWLEKKAGLSDRKLQAAVKACADNFIENVSDLREMSADDKLYQQAIPQAAIRLAINKGLESTDGEPEDKARPQNDTDQDRTQAKIQTKAKTASADDDLVLPNGFLYHYFVSHRKNHSKMTNVTEIQAIMTKDFLTERRLKGFFDVDNLTSIDMMSLTKSVKQSCCLVLFLDDETHLSHWVRSEIDTARKLRRPILTVINSDKFVERALIDQYQALGYGFIFSEQVVGYSTAYRQASYDKLMGSIRRAVAKCQSVPVTAPGSESSTPHTNETVGEQFKRTVLERYSSIQEAWKSFDSISETSGISRRDFKTVLSSLLGMKITSADKDFNAFFGHVPDASAATNAQIHGLSKAVLPMDCPRLPDAYRSRPKTEKSIVDLLVGKSKSSYVVAVGMGGVGKSCIKSAVLRCYPEVLQAFPDGVAWLSMSQKPDLLALQRRLHMQLIKDHLIAGSLEQQHEAIVKAARGKTILVTVDDCWTAEHFNCLDVVDTASTSSKVLVSSRISGLLPGSVEVRLSLFSVAESVELLASAAGLDSIALSASLVEVANLCSRLPLTLHIAARMIAESGEDWQDDVLVEMRANKGWQSDNSAYGVSVRDSVIIASENSIIGKDAKQIKTTLRNAAVFGEDQRIPMRVFLPLHLAAQAMMPENGDGTKVSKPVTITTIKRWLTVLIKRSLILELVKGSCQLHDIVRDYILSKYKDQAKLQRLQRLFVSELLQLQELWEDVKGEVIPKKKELDWFVTSALAYHIREAKTKHVVEESFFLSLLFHSALIVRVQAGEAIELQDLQEIAELYSSKGDHWKAAQLLKLTVNDISSVPKSKRNELAQLCLRSLDRITDKTREHCSCEVSVCCTIMYGLSQMGSTEWRESMGRLVKMYKLGKTDVQDAVAVARTLSGLGLLHLGLLAAKPQPTAEELELGSSYTRQGAIQFAIAVKTETTASPSVRFFWRLSSSGAFHTILCDTWTVPLNATERQVVSRANILQMESDYHFQLHKPMVEIDMLKMDGYLEFAPQIALLGLRLLDLQSVSESSQRWLQFQTKKHKLAEHSVVEYFYVLPVLVLAQEVHVSAEAFASAGSSWKNAESMPTKAASSFQWNIGDEFNEHPNSVIMFVKLGLLFTSPQLVEQAEVCTFLPPPGECKYLKDRVNETISLAESLSVLLAKASLEITDDTNASEMHARYQLAHHHNQIKNMHAKHALCSSLVSSEAVDDPQSYM